MHLGLKRKEEEEEEKKILDYRELCDFVDTALKICYCNSIKTSKKYSLREYVNKTCILSWTLR